MKWWRPKESMSGPDCWSFPDQYQFRGKCKLSINIQLYMLFNTFEMKRRIFTRCKYLAGGNDANDMHYKSIQDYPDSRTRYLVCTVASSVRDIHDDSSTALTYVCTDRVRVLLHYQCLACSSAFLFTQCSSVFTRETATALSLDAI